MRSKEYCCATTQAVGRPCCDRFHCVGVWIWAAVPCIHEYNW